MKTIDLLNVDFRGDCLSALLGITPNIFRKIKRIIIRTIDVDVDIYRPQSDIVDIIDLIKVHDFTLFRAVECLGGQEKIMEFINTRFVDNLKGNFHSWLTIDASKIIICVE